MEISKYILKGCLRNQRSSQEELYGLVKERLVRKAMCYVINHDEAEEIVNNGLFKVFTKIESFKGNHKNFGGWIQRIIINEAIDHVRKQKTYTSKHVGVDFISELAQDGCDIQEHPEYILRLLEKLSEKARTVFNLFAIEGYSHKEISQMLGITESTSKWNLHHARTQLKQWILEKELL